MKRSIIVICLCLCASLGLTGCFEKKVRLPDAPVVEYNGGVRMVKGTVNLRECPSTGCKIVLVLRKEDNVKVTAKQGSWVRVTVLNVGAEGWVARQYLEW